MTLKSSSPWWYAHTKQQKAHISSHTTDGTYRIPVLIPRNRKAAGGTTVIPVGVGSLSGAVSWGRDLTKTEKTILMIHEEKTCAIS